MTRLSLLVCAWAALVSATRKTAASAEALTIRLENNRFAPREVHARAGDTLRFVNGMGGPHNVAFDKDSIPPAARALIERAMGKDQIAPLAGPLLITPDETWTFVVPALSPGQYPFYCMPHLANMRGVLVIDAERRP